MPRLPTLPLLVLLALVTSGCSLWSFSYTDSSFRQQTAGASDYATLANGCALDFAGEVWCVHTIYDSATQTFQDELIDDTAGGGGWTSIGGNRSTQCALDGFDLFCWGSNTSGTAGKPAFLNPVVDEPNPIAPDQDWISVSNRSTVACAINTGHELWCWGSNFSGSLGTGATLLQWNHQPGQVQPGSQWVTVSTSRYTTCGIQLDGTLWCWGTDSGAILGGGGVTDPALEPVQIGAEDDWSKVSAAGDSVCGIRSNGDLYCWGRNDRGQLGTGNYRAKWQPNLVGGGFSAIEIHAQNTRPAMVCGIRNEGELWCWGDATPTERNFTPTRIGDSSDWHSVSASRYTIVALRND